MKDMKMDKQEVKENTRSKKEIQKLSLNAESASEILSEQLKSDVSNSRLMIATLLTLQ